MVNERMIRNEKLINSLITKIEILRGYEQTEEIQNEIIDLGNEIKSLSKDFKTLVSESKDGLKKLYLNEEVGDWSVAWSGGKDSTTVAGLVIDMLLSLDESQRNRTIHFLMSDTMVENPVLSIYMKSQVDKLTAFVNEKCLPVNINLVHRPVEHGYFYLVLGRGYFLPLNSGQGRWCTHRLKILPQLNKLKESKCIYQLTGVRLSESAKRKASIINNSTNSDSDSKVGGKESNKTYMPIVDFTIEDVWEYLQKERLPWTSTHDVRKLYKEATGECGFSNPLCVESKVSKSESCGARFGCWVCPVVLKDKSTEAMSVYNSWMEPLTYYRQLQLKFMGTYKPKKRKGLNRKERRLDLDRIDEINKEIKSIVKSGYMRNGKPLLKNGIHDTSAGTTNIESREWLFNKLLDTERKINDIREINNLYPIELISEEEKSLIVNQWAKDRIEAPYLVSNYNKTPISKLDILIKELESMED